MGEVVLTIPRVVAVGWVVRVALEAILERELGVRTGSLVCDRADVVDGGLAEPASLMLGQDFGTFGRLTDNVSN